MLADAGLRRLVGEWEERFAPIDEATPAETPPPRLWQSIVAQLPAEPAPAKRPSIFQSLSLWRGLTATGFGLAAALLLFVAVLPPHQQTGGLAVVAVLTDQQGKPAWIATKGAERGEILVTSLAPQPLDRKHSYELWAIDGGTAPKPLGLLTPQPGQPFALAAGLVPRTGGVLAISLEPEGGSPTGSPTGPVLFKGEIL